MEKYRFEPALRGHNQITGTQILDQISVVDRGSGEVYDTFQVDELAEDHFEQVLATVDGVDESLSELLVDDYSNLRTVSWASTSDVAHLENTYDIDAHEFMKALEMAGIYRNEQSPDSGKLHIPEHRDDMERHGNDSERQDSVTEQEDDSVQSGFGDF